MVVRLRLEVMRPLFRLACIDGLALPDCLGIPLFYPWQLANIRFLRTIHSLFLCDHHRQYRSLFHC